MIETFIERIDMYLVLLVLASAYMLIVSDSRYFKRENKQRARNQSIAIGVVMAIITVGLYIVRQTWL
ncbi:CLC_0170 family protein [Clostridium culturomicium]|uniref:CLC_0170 family protein n=2 Tax=Clostridium culturomicium TaxID=1499683 RepID=UPI000591791A